MKVNLAFNIVVLEVILAMFLLSSCSSSGKALEPGDLDECIDSDGGINEFEAGTVFLKLREFKDECFEDTLTEYYCISKSESGEIQIDCKNGCERDHCIEAIDECGNGILDIGEECDDSNTITEICEYGKDFCIVCNSECVQVEGETSYCGDSELDMINNEECDGPNLNGFDCSYFPNFDDGVISCNVDCTFNTDECYVEDQPEEEQKCGDNIRQIPNDYDLMEQCDGTDLNGKTCSDFSFVSGKLMCDSSCGYDTSECELKTSECGNGIIESGEQCDTNDFGELVCQMFGYASGQLICSKTCDLGFLNCE